MRRARRALAPVACLVALPGRAGRLLRRPRRRASGGGAHRDLRAGPAVSTTWCRSALRRARRTSTSGPLVRPPTWPTGACDPTATTPRCSRRRSTSTSPMSSCRRHYGRPGPPAAHRAGRLGAAAVRALDRRTDLVTVGIGGNDLSLFLDPGAELPRAAPARPRRLPVRRSAVGRQLLASTPAIGDHVEQALARVQRRAPDARVVLVGYPRIAPPDGACPRLLPFATGGTSPSATGCCDPPRRRGWPTRRRGRRDYLDLYDASAGHDV